MISDIGMPGKDGYEFIREVRSRPATDGGAVPAVALTAFARTEDRRRSIMAGYQSHVTKPVDAGELLAVVAMLTGKTPGDVPKGSPRGASPATACLIGRRISRLTYRNVPIYLNVEDRP